MKKLVLLFLALIVITACKKEAPKDYVTFSGKIIDKNSDSLIIRSRTFTKRIDVKEDGTFSDTLKVESGTYNVYDGSESSSIYLENGFDITMSLDTNMFDETISYTGNGSEHSNFLAKNSLMQEEMFDMDALSELDSLGLESKLTDFKKQLNDFYDSNKDIDTSITNSLRKNVTPMLNFYKGYIGEAIALKRDLPKGAPSPIFENYENYAGGTTSLSDLKGKYVYIDIWATWCGPCIAEIPSLKKVETAYHDKNIEFVSISTDNGRGYKEKTVEASKIGWKKMIEKKELSGIQLFADNAFDSDFIKAYKINAIPRFLLIDPEGNIISADAPRPSDPKLIELFNELKI